MSIKHLNLKSILHSNQNRNAIVRKNIFLSILIKVLSMLCTLIVVPVTLDYLNQDLYGVMLTITSILVWFAFFDVGLGNGLRNYLTQSISLNDYESGSRYLSTTIAILSILALALAVISVPLILFIDFKSLLNVHSVDNETLRNVMAVAVVFTLMNFIVKNVGVVFMTLQKYAVNDLLVFLGHLVTLIAIWLLKTFTESSLLYVILAYTLSPVLVFIIAGVILFRRYPHLRLSHKYLDFSLSSKLMGKGVSFFVIQITSCLVIFGSANVFITHFCGPEAVTEYNIAYKYFNLLTIGFTLIISPLWSAYTDAYVKGDMAWIKQAFMRSQKWWLLTLLAAGAMLALSPIVYDIWIQDRVSVSVLLSASVCLYLCLFNFNNCVTYLLNGLNTIYVQLLTSVTVTVIYIIAVLLLAPRYGVIGISLCMSFCYLLQGAIHLYQCRLIISGRATGIWRR